MNNTANNQAQRQPRWITFLFCFLTILLPLIFVIIGSVMCWKGYHIYQQETESLRFEKTYGTLYSSGTEYHKSEKSSYSEPVAVYDYVVDGTAYRNDVVAYDARDLSFPEVYLTDGARIPVYYDPQNPQDAILFRAGKPSMPGWGYGGILMAVIGLIALFAFRHAALTQKKDLKLTMDERYQKLGRISKWILNRPNASVTVNGTTFYAEYVSDGHYFDPEEEQNDECGDDAAETLAPELPACDAYGKPKSSWGAVLRTYFRGKESLGGRLIPVLFVLIGLGLILYALSNLASSIARLTYSTTTVCVTESALEKGEVNRSLGYTYTFRAVSPDSRVEVNCFYAGEEVSFNVRRDAFDAILKEYPVGAMVEARAAADGSDGYIKPAPLSNIAGIFVFALFWNAISWTAVYVIYQSQKSKFSATSSCE